MKWAIILLLPCFAYAGTGSNSESTSVSTGANINNQTILNETNSLIIDSVRCPKPSISFIGGSSFINNGSNIDQYNLGIALSVPLLTNDCNKATSLKLKLLELTLRREKESHAIKLAASCAELKEKKIKVDICKRFQYSRSFY